MKENVGTADRIVRSLVGPALLALGYTRLGGREGRTAGLAAMILGTSTLESAITKVCPVNAMLGIDTRRKRDPLTGTQEAVRPSREDHEGVTRVEGETFREEAVRTNWLKGMYAANIGFSLPFGFANLIDPRTMQRLLGVPAGDPIQYGIVNGAVPLAFGLAGVLGLRSPLRLAPVLALQTAYKSFFLLGVALPRAVKGKLPRYTAPMIAVYAFFIIGNLIALRFPSVLSKAPEA